MRILQIGNYPPPACGWAMQTKLLVEELRRRGHVCQVLNINESRKKKSSEYVDVQNGFDYVYKLVRFAGKGYQFQVHVNGQSKTRSEEHTSELQSRLHLVCRLLLEKKKYKYTTTC